MRSTRLLHIVVGSLLLAIATAAIATAQQAPPAEGTEADLIGVLKSADTPLFDKAKACQRLAVIGTKECVPALASLLDDEELSHYARYALEPLPDPAVDEALRAALDKLEGRLLVGVINTIGMRQDRGAVGALKKLMSSAAPQVAASAAGSLGRIHTAEAVAALQVALQAPEPLRTAVGDACLAAADLLIADGERAKAATLCRTLREAEVAAHIHIGALHGQIRALGAEGMPLLVECLASDDQDVFRVGLGMANEIGGPEAAQKLINALELPEPVDVPKKGLVIVKAEYGAGDRWADATDQVAAAAAAGTPLTADNSLVGDPAPRVVKMLRIVFVKDGEEETVELPEKEQITLEGGVLPELHPRAVLLICALGDLGEKVALPIVLEAAENDAHDVRRAAIRVLGSLGDASAVGVLLRTAVDDAAMSEAAQESLVGLANADVDAAILEQLHGADGRKRLVLLRLVGDRGIASAVSTLKKAAESEEIEIAVAAIRALRTTIGLDELPLLIDHLVSPASPEKSAAAKESLKIAVLRMPDRNATAAKLVAPMASAGTAARADLLELLGIVGGERALEAVAAAARTGDDATQDAATQVLGGWMSPDAAPVLLELARSGNEKFRVRCLRGFIRIPRQLDVPGGARIAMCRQAIEAASRDQEKALALEVLGRNPSAESLAAVVPHLDNKALHMAAAAAAVAIAEKIVEAHPDPVAEAMKKAAEAKDAEVANKARSLLRRAKKSTGGK